MNLESGSSTKPNGVPDLTTFDDLCSADGHYHDATTGTAVAGYTATAAADQAAITTGPAGRMILSTFTPQDVNQDADGDTVQDMVELDENMITHIC